MSAKKEMKTEGLHTHRFKDNPEEKRFAEAWHKEGYGYQGQCLLDLMLGDGSARAQHPASARDRVVAATVIQWLGSPVGQNFLERLGYKKER